MLSMFVLIIALVFAIKGTEIPGSPTPGLIMASCVIVFAVLIHNSCQDYNDKEPN